MNLAHAIPPVGHEFAPKTWEITREKIETYSRYVFFGRDTRNIHTVDEIARRAGLPRAVAQGRYPIGYLSERMVDLFGAGFVEGGRLDVTLARPIFPGDRVTVRVRVAERLPEGDAIRLVSSVWLENQHGEKVTVGTASGLVRVTAVAAMVPPRVGRSAFAIAE